MTEVRSLFQKFAHDLRTTLAPQYPRILKRLLRLLPRSLSAEALTVLLATFSALFKYVLVPSADAELLRQAWAAFCDVLPQCHPEVQRATAEVWGATLRRVKISLRNECVRTIAASSNSGRGDVCAWIFVTACKVCFHPRLHLAALTSLQSVSQTLHTVTASLTTPLLEHYMSCDSAEDGYTLVRRVLTALIHHCKGAEQFSPASDVVVNTYLETVKGADEERTRRILEVVAVVCSVRQGSRMSRECRMLCIIPLRSTHACADTQLGTLLAEYAMVPLTDALHPALLKVAVGALSAGDMALWMAHGRKVFDRCWERPLLGIELTGALSDLSWGAWKLVALSYVSSSTHKLLESHPMQTLELLAALHREKRLNEMDIVWKQRFQAWVDKTLSSWERSDDYVCLLLAFIWSI